MQHHFHVLESVTRCLFRILRTLLGENCVQSSFTVVIGAIRVKLASTAETTRFHKLFAVSLVANI